MATRYFRRLQRRYCQPCQDQIEGREAEPREPLDSSLLPVGTTPMALFSLWCAIFILPQTGDAHPLWPSLIFCMASNSSCALHAVAHLILMCCLYAWSEEG